MSRRKLFNNLSAELIQAAKTLDSIETGFRLVTQEIGMNSLQRQSQLETSNSLKQVVLKKIYSLIRDELNEQPQ